MESNGITKISNYDIKKSSESYRKLTSQESMYLLDVIAASDEINDNGYPPELETVAHKIIDKRVEHFNLPIAFANDIKVMLSTWASNPGRCVAFLIDCLQAIPDSDKYYNVWKVNTLDKPTNVYTVDLDFVCENVYPHGVYTEEAFGYYVDNCLKRKTVPWSELY